jgi:hypothetical protein
MQIAVTGQVDRVGSQAVNIGLARAAANPGDTNSRFSVPEAAAKIKEFSFVLGSGHLAGARPRQNASVIRKAVIVSEDSQSDWRARDGWFCRGWGGRSICLLLFS